MQLEATASHPIASYVGEERHHFFTEAQNAKISKSAFLSCGLIWALLEMLTVLSLFWLTYHLLPDSFTSPRKSVDFIPFYFLLNAL